MKKILLFAISVLLICFSYTTNAQCTFTNPGIRMVAPPSTNQAGQCEIRVELSFDILHNPGGKYFWIHLWPTNSYPDYNYPESHPPTTSLMPGENNALDNSIATFGFFHQQGALDVLLDYPPDHNVPNFQSGYTISEIEDGGVLPGSDRYTINGLIITLPLNCSIPQSFTADLWESQSDKAQTVACVSKGVVIYANDPKVTGFLVCQTPRTYNFTITTINTSGLMVSYNVYIDDGNGIYNKATDSITIASGSNLQLDNTNNYKFVSGIMTYLPYSNQKPYSDRALWMVVTSPSITNEVYARLDNACIPLPVSFKSFTAVRNHSNVLLAWETASEQDNNGFAVERNIYGVWEQVAFITSQAANGNSDVTLNYQYTDLNNTKGITQYRIKQVGLDAKATYSEIRAVRAEGQMGKVIVFPNPGNGQVNIVFEDAGVKRDIALVDLYGRTVKQIRNISNNNITMNLAPGMYLLRVVVIETGEQVVEKIVVNK